jgi:hypothetical protein
MLRNFYKKSWVAKRGFPEAIEQRGACRNGERRNRWIRQVPGSRKGPGSPPFVCATSLSTAALLGDTLHPRQRSSVQIFVNKL